MVERIIPYCLLKLIKHGMPMQVPAAIVAATTVVVAAVVVAVFQELF